MTVPQVVAVDSNEGYSTEWFCEPPAEGEPFIVSSEEWVDGTDGTPIRRIYMWAARR